MDPLQEFEERDGGKTPYTNKGPVPSTSVREHKFVREPIEIMRKGSEEEESILTDGLLNYLNKLMETIPL